YLAGGSSSGSPIVMRSVTGGGNWQEVFLTDTNKNVYTGWAGAHGDHQWSFPEAPFGFEVCKNDSRIVTFGDYSCSHITTNAGFDWKQQYLNTADQNAKNIFTPTGKKYHGIGLENTTNWQVMWTDSTHLLSAFSDINGVMSDDKGLSWKFIPNLTSNSTYRIVQHTNGNIYACVSNRHDIYQTTTIYDNTLNTKTGAVYVSTNNGTSFSQIKSFNGPVIWIALDPTNSDRMYAAVINSDTTKGGIWKTNNLSAGVSSVWTKCKNPSRTEGHAFNVNVLPNGDLVVSFSARRATTSTAFSQSSGVFYSTDGGQTWADRTDANMKFYTQDVVVDKNDTSGSTWYASVFSAWGSGVPAGTGGLYKTVNKGISWSQISTLYRVNSCTINPSNPDEMYVTTETDGLWYSGNINSANPSFSLVDAYPFRHPTRVFFNPWNPSEMWVSAFGYGMATASLSCNMAVPTVSQNNGMLTSSAATTYQWLLNGSPIPGANSQNYTPLQSGDYSVQVGDGGICSSISSATTVTVITTDMPLLSTDNKAIRLFPNPVSGQLTVIGDDLNNVKSVQIYDMIGGVVINELVREGNEVKINVSSLSNGVYLLRLGKLVKRFIKE
ncbi:MAG: BNR/Asp-box repeat protein, partial [Bacteroidota bacterium]|nr:BNR/Asp-box repeat protein [Bacteroidota bacterium]